jgi:hypothetical protein
LISPQAYAATSGRPVAYTPAPRILLEDLKQHIREVRQVPLYLLTEEEIGALLRIEPAP